MTTTTKKKKAPKKKTASVARNKRVRNAKRASRMKKAAMQKRLDATVAAMPTMPTMQEVSLTHPIKTARKLAKKGARLLLGKVTRKAKATVKATRARVTKKKSA